MLVVLTFIGMHDPHLKVVSPWAGESKLRILREYDDLCLKTFAIKASVENKAYVSTSRCRDPCFVKVF